MWNILTGIDHFESINSLSLVLAWVSWWKFLVSIMDRTIFCSEVMRFHVQSIKISAIVSARKILVQDD